MWNLSALKILSLFLLYIVIFNYAHGAAGCDGCENDSFLKNHKPSDVSCPKPKDFVKTSVAEVVDHFLNANFMFFGETHREQGEAFYLKILAEVAIRDLKSLARTCLFLEAEDQTQKFLDKCLQSPNGAKTSRQHGTLSCDGQEKSLFWPYLTYGAINLGVKVIAVDSSTKPCSDSYLCRNRYMAQKIDEYFVAGSCDRGIAINGHAHLSKHGAMKPIQSFLKSKMKSASHALLYPPATTSSSSPISSLSPLCKADWSSIPTPFIFRPGNSELPIFNDLDHATYERTGEFKVIWSGKWHQADFVALLPASESVLSIETAPMIEDLLHNGIRLPLR